MPTLEELMEEYRLTPKTVDLQSTGDKNIAITKTREETPSGVQELKDLMEQSRRNEAAREADVRNLVQGLSAKPERNLLAEAMVAFLPTLIGYGAGRAAGGVGVAESGIAAGAQAGLTGLERMEKSREEERKRESERLKLRPEFKKLESESRRLGNLEKAYYDALAGGKKTTEVTAQAVKETRKKEEQVKVGLQPKILGDASFKALPKEQQIVVTDLAKNMAAIKGVSSSLRANLDDLKNPNISEDQKIVAGESLFKLLNMKDGTGRDAVGVEEARRIGAFLQAKIGNITGVGAFIRGKGTNLKEFIQQVELSFGAANRNAQYKQEQIDEIYSKAGLGRSSAPSAAPSVKPSPAPDQDMRAKLQKLSDAEKREFMTANPDRKKQLLEQAGKR